MPIYRVNVVFRRQGHVYGPGQTLKMTEEEAAPHLEAGTLEANEPDPTALAIQQAAEDAAARATEKARKAAAKADDDAAP